MDCLAAFFYLSVYHVNVYVMGSQQAATEMAGGASPRAHAEQYRVNSTRQIRLDGFGLLGKE